MKNKNKFNLLFIFIYIVVHILTSQIIYSNENSNLNIFDNLYISYISGNPEIILQNFSAPIKLYQFYKVTGNEKFITNNGYIELLNEFFLLRSDKNSSFYFNKDKLFIEKGRYYLNFLNEQVEINFNKINVKLIKGEYFIFFSNNQLVIISNNGKIFFNNEEIELTKSKNTYYLDNNNDNTKYIIKNTIIIENFYIYFNKKLIEKDLKILRNYSSFYLEEILANLDINNKFVIKFEDIKKIQIEIENKYNSISKALLNSKETELDPYELLNSYIEYLKMTSLTKTDIEYIFNYYLIFYSKCKVIINSSNILENKIKFLENRQEKDIFFDSLFLNEFKNIKNNFNIIQDNLKIFDKSIENGKESFFTQKSKIFFTYNYIEESETYLKKVINNFIDNSKVITSKNIIKILIDLYLNSNITNYSITSNINKIINVKSEINLFLISIKNNFIFDIHNTEGLFYYIIYLYYKDLSDKTIQNLNKSNNLANLFIFLYKNEKINNEFFKKYYEESLNLIKSINENKIELLKVTNDLTYNINNIFFTLKQKDLFIERSNKTLLYKNNLELINNIFNNFKNDLLKLYNNYNQIENNIYEKKEISYIANFYKDVYDKLINYTFYFNDFYFNYFGIDKINIEVYFSEFINLSKQIPVIFDISSYSINKYIDNFYYKFNTGIIAIDQLLQMLDSFSKDLNFIYHNFSENYNLEFYYLNSKFSLNNTNNDFINNYKKYLISIENNINFIIYKKNKLEEKLKELKTSLEIFYINYNNENFNRHDLLKNINNTINLLDDYNIYFAPFYSEILEFELNLNYFLNFLNYYKNTNSSINNLIIKVENIINQFLYVINTGKSTLLLSETIKLLK